MKKLRRVTNLTLKRTIEDYSRRMKHAAKALDRIQRYQSKISDADEIWKELLETLRISESNSSDVILKANQRISQPLTSFHFLANMVDLKYLDTKLSKCDVDATIKLLLGWKESSHRFK